MVLTVEERKLFYKNWLKLLAFVNDRYGIIYDFGNPANPVGLNINDITKIRNKLWKNSFLIDKYINIAKLNEDDEKIVKSWKKFIKGKFIIIKELQKYCVFLEMKNEILYGVNGISNPFSVMIPSFPFMVETVLIPFREKIIFDSLLACHNIEFGPNYKKSFKEKYKELKNEKNITEVLN
jgi:hypothetical protein